MGIHRRPPVFDWARYFYERCVLMPAADLLPRAAAIALADAAGFVDALLPSEATIVARSEIAAAIGVSGIRAYPATARRLAEPRRDLVMLRRLRRGREHPRDWAIRQLGRERVDEMLAAGRPFVVCNGHFPHGIDQAAEIMLPQMGGNSVHAPIPERRFDPAVLRQRLQNRLLYGLSRQLAGFKSEMFIPNAGTKGGVSTMVAHLAEGGVVRIVFDAIWDRPNAYRRPFAGMAQRGFARGTARVARLAQCPIVFYVAVREPDGGVRIEWGPWVDPPAPADEAGEVCVMDQLIDMLEVTVARYPLQYLHPIGDDRAWDPASRCWRAPAVTAAGRIHDAPRPAATDAPPPQ
jgi:lauroyl/myristoyl acyltransferase